ncbi:unnamed protein product [Dracunculus medinensis]|uniref:Uncharacterized protein n=1 Tax=Dracunculus medinensis TaxID=318479 RepID=A0A0N4U860_DRAME|nr:unnamed protein product [Dracunculus medinensis]
MFIFFTICILVNSSKEINQDCGIKSNKLLKIIGGKAATQGANAPEVFVSLGSNSLYNLENVYRISRQIIHPEYNEFLVENDIALIQVKISYESYEKIFTIKNSVKKRI